MMTEPIRIAVLNFVHETAKHQVLAGGALGFYGLG